MSYVSFGENTWPVMSNTTLRRVHIEELNDCVPYSIKHPECKKEAELIKKIERLAT